jgi:hypothetical protein
MTGSRSPSPSQTLWAATVRSLCYAALLLLGWGQPGAVDAEPRVYRIGIVAVDAVRQGSLPPHLGEMHAESMVVLRQLVEDIFGALGRFETATWMATRDGRRYEYSGPGDADFVAHFTLRAFGKIYRNESVLRYGKSPLNAAGGTSSPYEIYSRPAISGRLEVELVDLSRNRVFWSTLHDSTAIVPHDSRIFLYNPSKYADWNHPALIRDHLSSIVRLQANNHSMQGAMASADRWFVSLPKDDIATAEGLLDGLVLSLRTELDNNLPLEARVAELLPSEDGKGHVVLDIGAQSGLRPRLRLDLWRPLPSEQKVGQVEVVRVDSHTAVARISKVDRGLRRQGEGPAVGDRAVSRKRHPPEVSKRR